MRVLVLQLTRFGDVLQTIPVLSALQRKYPNAEIDLLARKKYSAAAKIFQYANVIDFESDFPDFCWMFLTLDRMFVISNRFWLRCI